MNNNNEQDFSFSCRISNHHLSAQRVEIEDGSSHYNKYGIADQCILLVTCHDYNLQWNELWTASRWFFMNNNSYYQKIECQTKKKKRRFSAS
jgi:hypothetical protein